VVERPRSWHRRSSTNIDSVAVRRTKSTMDGSESRASNPQKQHAYLTNHSNTATQHHGIMASWHQSATHQQHLRHHNASCHSNASRRHHKCSLGLGYKGVVISRNMRLCPEMIDTVPSLGKLQRTFHPTPSSYRCVEPIRYKGIYMKKVKQHRWRIATAVLSKSKSFPREFIEKTTLKSRGNSRKLPETRKSYARAPGHPQVLATITESSTG